MGARLSSGFRAGSRAWKPPSHETPFVAPKFSGDAAPQRREFQTLPQPREEVNNTYEPQKMAETLKRMEEDEKQNKSKDPQVAGDDEYEQALKALAGVITSSTPGEKQAAKFDSVTDMISAASKGMNVSEAARNQGRLLYEDWILLYDLHRKNPQVWDAEALAARFSVDLQLVQSTLRYCAIPVIVAKESKPVGYWNIVIKKEEPSSKSTSPKETK